MKTLLLVSACAFVPVVACVGYWIVNPPYGSDSAAMQVHHNINALPLDRWGRQFVYERDAIGGRYRFVSYGRDGVSGGRLSDADCIGRWCVGG